MVKLACGLKQVCELLLLSFLVDLSDWFNTVWPRAAAVAERLWTVPEKLDVVEAESRLMHFRGLLVNRGIPAAPVLNKLGRAAPSQQSSYFWQ